MYELRFDIEAEKIYARADIQFARRLNRCVERLQENPLYHPNIKMLKGNLIGLYRYRIGEWRVVYEVLENEKIVNILQIVHRKDAY